MRVERYYDICCDGCYRHLSSDFNRGFAYERSQCIQWAKEEGFKEIGTKVFCPYCVEKIKSNAY